MPDRPARPWYDPRARFAAISGPYLTHPIWSAQFRDGHFAGWNAAIAAMGDRAGSGLLARLGLWLLQWAVALREN